MNCGVGRRHGLNLVSLWLWCRPAATALIRPLAWERPYAASMALKSPPPKKKKTRRWMYLRREASRSCKQRLLPKQENNLPRWLLAWLLPWDCSWFASRPCDIIPKPLGVASSPTPGHECGGLWKAILLTPDPGCGGHRGEDSKKPSVLAPGISRPSARCSDHAAASLHLPRSVCRTLVTAFRTERG